MPVLMSAQARPELRPYVRAYAQRIWEAHDPCLIESVPAMNADGTDIRRIASGITIGGCPDRNCVTPSWGPKPK